MVKKTITLLIFKYFSQGEFYKNNLYFVIGHLK